MKIRNPKTIARIAGVLAGVAKVWMNTTSFRYRPLGDYMLGDRPDLLGDARYVYTLWHEYLFTPTYAYSRPDSAVIIGMHSDGELLAQVNQKLGNNTIRGSSSRGGTAALLKVLRSGEMRHFGLTPDGPRGPRRQCQFGTVYMASRTGVPVACVGFGYSRCWRLRSWDRFAIPMPFCRIRVVTGHPIHVPAKLGTEELEPYRLEVERQLELMTTIAENWAQTGEFDPLDYQSPADWTPKRPACIYPSARMKGIVHPVPIRED
jgi:lysophospholipid acyltransferase (LPLAT)-like uncharacterized protein